MNPSEKATFFAQVRNLISVLETGMQKVDVATKLPEKADVVKKVLNEKFVRPLDRVQNEFKILR
jgi:hypothetical protein